MTRLVFPSSTGSDAGKGNILRNSAATQQAIAAATRTYIAGSALNVGAVGGLKVGTRLRWVFNMAKTAAGTAASTFDIAFGTAGTTADTARVSFTKPAGTAAADEGRVVIEAVVRSVSATGVVVGLFNLTHNLAATGHAQIPSVNVATVSSGFANNVGVGDGSDFYVGVCLTSGASDAITVEAVDAEAVSL